LFCQTSFCTLRNFLLFLCLANTTRASSRRTSYQQTSCALPSSGCAVAGSSRPCNSITRFCTPSPSMSGTWMRSSPLVVVSSPARTRRPSQALQVPGVGSPITCAEPAACCHSGQAQQSGSTFGPDGFYPFSATPRAVEYMPGKDFGTHPAVEFLHVPG
jgi:hypothetical protein